MAHVFRCFVGLPAVPSLHFRGAALAPPNVTRRTTLQSKQRPTQQQPAAQKPTKKPTVDRTKQRQPAGDRMRANPMPSQRVTTQRAPHVESLQKKKPKSLDTLERERERAYDRIERTSGQQVAQREKAVRQAEDAVRTPDGRSLRDLQQQGGSEDAIRQLREQHSAELAPSHNKLREAELRRELEFHEADGPMRKHLLDQSMAPSRRLAAAEEKLSRARAEHGRESDAYKQAEKERNAAIKEAYDHGHIAQQLAIGNGLAEIGPGGRLRDENAWRHYTARDTNGYARLQKAMHESGDKGERIQTINDDFAKRGIDMKLPGDATPRIVKQAEAYLADRRQQDRLAAAGQKPPAGSELPYQRREFQPSPEMLDGNSGGALSTTGDIDTFADILDDPTSSFWRGQYQNGMQKATGLEQFRQDLGKLPLPKEPKHEFDRSEFVDPRTPNVSVDEVVEGQPTTRPNGQAGWAELRQKYMDGSITPTQVADRLLGNYAADQRRPNPISAFVDGTVDPKRIRAEAAASTQRYADYRQAVAEGREPPELAPNDGMFFGAKSQFAWDGKHDLGTKKPVPARENAEAIEQLRNNGGILFGMTRTTELGMKVDSHVASGKLPNGGYTLNPHNLGHSAGGSNAGGGAAAQAFGIPILGSDAGGSNGLPGVMSGVYTATPPRGTISQEGEYPLTSTLSRPGVMANDPAGIAAMYGTLNPDAKLTGMDQKRLTITEPDGTTRPMRVGYDPSWVADSSPAVQANFDKWLKDVKRLGGEPVPVRIPFVEHSQRGQMMQYGMEAGQQFGIRPGQGGKLEDRLGYDPESNFSPPTRVNFSLVQQLLKNGDADTVGRLRNGLAQGTDNLFENKIDVIASPFSAIETPAINPGAQVAQPGGGGTQGDSALKTLGALQRYSTLANMANLGRVGFPYGKDKNGLPMGIFVHTPGTSGGFDRGLQMLSVMHRHEQQSPPGPDGRIYPLIER